jgi:hypothetical protein
MPLAAYALVTLQEAKDRLGVTDEDRDDRLVEFINEVSRLVMQTTGREYAPPAASSARIARIKNGSSVVDLYPYEARSVTSVTIAAGTDDEYVVPTTDWQLAPVVAPDGVYDRIQLAQGVTVSSQFHEVPVTVVGTWGWPAVPNDVKGWVLEMVEDRWKQDVAFYADADGLIREGSSGSSDPITIPFRIRDEMEHAKRVRLGSV